MSQTEITKADYEALAAFRAALRRFVRFSEEGARDLNITPQQHQAMLAVMGQKGRDWASIVEIARFMQLKHHTTVGLIDRSVSAGLVLRSEDPVDRRQVRITLTAKGKEILENLSERNLRELQMMRKSFRFPITERTFHEPKK